MKANPRMPERMVSIHAPLARSNFPNRQTIADKVFQYMLLLRGATRQPGDMERGKGFNTCSSCEEQPLGIPVPLFQALFQYMLLLRGATKLAYINAFNEMVSIHAPLARSNRGNINRSGSKCKSKNRAKYQLSFVKEHYCILRFLIIV